MLKNKINTLAFLIREIFINIIERIENYVLSNQRRFKYFLHFLGEEKLLKYGKKRATQSAFRAYNNVPAYRDFLSKNQIDSVENISLKQFPIMNKNSYIRSYKTEKRCIEGSFLLPGVAIDESSGSTGTPYNWVRGKKERFRSQKLIARMIEWFIGNENRVKIAINAFSMGAWATGVNMGEALSNISVVKSTGPDLDKILNTLEFFGSKPGYVICGYPPFLKLIIDKAIERKFPIEDYTLHAFVGGESISEELRDYILKYFQSCTSGYGASDLEMGIATETPESITIRNIFNQHKDLRKSILGEDSRVPMVFQYNPLMHYIETNENNEVIITLNYSKILSPRIRYNIGDEGKIFTRKEILSLLKRAGLEIKINQDTSLPFPYLVLFGRLDNTISIMGANIYPEDIEKILYEVDEIANGFSSFMISKTEDKNNLAIPQIFIEWHNDNPPVLSLDNLSNICTNALVKLNSDFKNAYHEYSGNLKLDITLHGFRKGPFSNLKQGIKNHYLKKT